MRSICKRVGRFVYSEKQSECRAQTIFPRKLSVIANNSIVSAAYYTSVYLNTERELERGFELGFKPGLRMRASFAYY